MKASCSRKRPRLFMALDAGKDDGGTLRCLTTEVMQWSGEVWILDLSLFLGYWKNRAAAVDSSVVGLWRDILDRTFGAAEDGSRGKVVAMSPAYSACCARNPWVAALMLQGMKEREVGGLILENSRFGQSLFREVSWEVWWRGISALEDRFQGAKIKGFKRPAFRKQCHRLRLGAARLGFGRPWEMRILNCTGVKKRFGTTLAKVWKWAYGEEADTEETLHQAGFPWKGYRFREPPVAKRYLDYPPVLWEQIAPLLCEDLDKLCGSLENSGEQATRIDWHITFEDMSGLHVPICFRNPHDLRREEGEHVTTLLQANYGFTAAAAEMFPTEAGGSEEYALPSISSWEVRLSASLVVPNVFHDIFGEISEKDSDTEVLLRLENELPVRLNRFSPRQDWLPEDSYAARAFDGEAEAVDSEIERSLEAVAEDRPLYIRSEPLPLKEATNPSSERFLESTMNKWWKEEASSALERDYFKHVDSDGNATWVFRDSHGHWYQHGIFG